jgi:4-hydroxy-2-oxoheptanedioate aldolase
LSTLKEKVLRKERVVTIIPRFRSPLEIEFIGTLGFDAVFIDCEHGNVTIDQVEDLARAARVSGIFSIVRPEDNVRQLMIRYLDCGVDGIMVPHVDSVEDAQRVVSAASYGRASSEPGARPWSIKNKLVIAMVESPAAVKNLPEILKVDGLDLFFIGPVDLAAEMGYAGQPSHPEVMKVREYATKTILGAGKPVGTLANFDNVHELIDSGVTYLTISGTQFTRRGAGQFRELLNRELVGTR